MKSVTVWVFKFALLLGSPSVALGWSLLPKSDQGDPVKIDPRVLRETLVLGTLAKDHCGDSHADDGVLAKLEELSSGLITMASLGQMRWHAVSTNGSLNAKINTKHSLAESLSNLCSEDHQQYILSLVIPAGTAGDFNILSSAFISGGWTLQGLAPVDLRTSSDDSLANRAVSKIEPNPSMASQSAVVEFVERRRVRVGVKGVVHNLCLLKLRGQQGLVRVTTESSCATAEKAILTENGSVQVVLENPWIIFSPYSSEHYEFTASSVSISETVSGTPTS